jgi:hypothetical protein
MIQIKAPRRTLPQAVLVHGYSISGRSTMKMQQSMMMRRVDAACERLNAELVVVVVVLGIATASVATLRLAQSAAEMSGIDMPTLFIEDVVPPAATTVW